MIDDDHARRKTSAGFFQDIVHGLVVGQGNMYPGSPFHRLRRFGKGDGAFSLQGFCLCGGPIPYLDLLSLLQQGLDKIRAEKARSEKCDHVVNISLKVTYPIISSNFC